MPVLLDTDYISKAGVSGFPTTWFLGPDGRKMFEKVGGSKHLLEEFTWRVEAMMEIQNAAGTVKKSDMKTQ